MTTHESAPVPAQLTRWLLPALAALILGLAAGWLAMNRPGPMAPAEAPPVAAPAATAVAAPTTPPALQPVAPAPALVEAAPAAEGVAERVPCETTTDPHEQAACHITGSAQQAPAYAPAGPIAAPAAPAELGPLGCIRVYVSEHAYHTVNPDGSTCYESVTVLGGHGGAVEVAANGTVLREEPAREPTPADPMSCARRGVGACRGSRP
jgi:hypothetical protein